MDENIRIGIITRGDPEFVAGSLNGDKGFYLKNLLIGKGFHWQRVCKVFLPGEIEYLDEPQGDIRIVNSVPIEKYIESVISSEMNRNSPVEFLKAHAVISRSWALKKIADADSCCGGSTTHQSNTILAWEESDSHHGFDVCSDDHCQRYQGMSLDISRNVRDAVDLTRGEVLVAADGKIADARFSKCCGGKTELFSSCWDDRDYDYLPSKDDPGCDLSTMKPDERNSFLSAVLKDYDRNTHNFYRWTYDVDKEKLRVDIQKKYGIDLGRINNIEVTKRGPSNRAIIIRIIGADRELSVGKELAIRRLLAENCLYSSMFQVEDCGHYFRLHGGGWGHGVGLCQIGAARMAFEGMDYRSILDFYYPGAKVVKIESLSI